MVRVEKVIREIGHILEENNVSYNEFSSICNLLHYGYETQKLNLIKNSDIKFNLEDVLSNGWTIAHIKNQEKKEKVN